MLKFQRMLPFLALAAAFAIAAPAAELEGILMDQMCSGKVESEGVAAAKAHTRDCALMPPCVQSGFGVVTDDAKFIPLDAEGNKKAEEALKATDKKDNLRVRVSGEKTDDVFKVTSLTLL